MKSAVVIGSGPNGLSAAITMARAGWDVTVHEAADTVGGGVRSEELTFPGFVHDVCSAIHPLGRESPFFRDLELPVDWVQPEAPAAHPLDDGTAVTTERSLLVTAERLGEDRAAYLRLFNRIVPRWSVFEAFTTPGLVRPQLSQMPDGATYFWIARTVNREYGGWHAPRSMVAIGLGCEASRARELVYADGMDLESREAIVPVGLTCRLCERIECEQRAFPPLQHPLRVNANVRGVSFYAPPGGR